MIAEENPLRRVLVASALPFEGKSTVVFNLGLAFGEVGKRVIVADADFHRPTLRRIANTDQRKGFTDLLAGNTKLADTITPIPDNLYMAAAADGIVLVVAVGQTRPRDVLRTKAILERAGTPILGVVLNRTPVKQLNSYYKQYSAYYGA